MMNFKKNQFFLFLILSLIMMFSSMLLFKLFNSKMVYIMEVELVKVLSKSFDLIILLDIYSLSFFLSVILITTSVMVFSYSYMDSDLLMVRFHMILMSFVLSMVLLIFSPNLFSILIGWDGLGMSSYLLVIYYSSEKSFKAGMITALTNRIGDCLLIVCISMMFYQSSLSSSFMDLNYYENYFFLVMVFLIAATTKSAQIPFSAWLPAAMAAPTPVSALVHSSTLVTAGVYLLFRFSFLYCNKLGSSYLLWAGGLTMFLASLSAMSEMDMKKMVALSTLSQLGVMVLSLGSNMIKLGFLHLLAHAFFKALLFISTGSMIHASSSYQDMRMAGSMTEVTPLTSSIMFICLFSLMGMPFMVSFYSKEIIIETMMVMNLNIMAWGMMVLGVLFTTVYSMRMFYLVGMSYSMQMKLHMKLDNDLFSSYSMFILLIPATCSGVLLSNMLFLPSTITISTIHNKMMIYFLLTIGLTTIFYIYKLNYMKNKTNQLMWLNMWNLPIVSPSIPMMTLEFNGMKLAQISDYSWTYNLSSKFIMDSSTALIKTSVMYNSLNFSRLISIILVFLLLLMIM